MTWTHGGDYMAEKKSELKRLLLLRGLAYSGTKEKMVSRLIRHDRQHPFPFQKLPPEIRNEIYILVASQDASEFPSSQLPVKGHTEGRPCFLKLEAIKAQSSLFRTCKQTRSEGLLLFYQYHHFELAVVHGGCFLAILSWLKNIGPLIRQNIRHLSISYITKCSASDTQHMERIHEGLSDLATVSYKSYDYPDLLWRIGELYERRTSRTTRKVPVFRLAGADVEHSSYKYRVDFRAISRSWGRLESALVFLPGNSWFGPELPRFKR